MTNYEKIKALGFKLVNESQCEVTYKKDYDWFTHMVEIKIGQDINIFSMEDGSLDLPIGLNIEEMEAFLDKMKEMQRRINSEVEK